METVVKKKQQLIIGSIDGKKDELDGIMMT